MPHIRQSSSATDERSEKRSFRRSLLLTSAVGSAAVLASAISTPAQAQSVKRRGRKVENFGVPWEEQYGYAQAVQVGDTLYVSGQFSHDEKGNMVAPAQVDASGRIVDHGNMEAQMRRTYENAKKMLSRFGATMADVVEEVLYVTDMDAAFAAAGPVRKAAYASARPTVASTILVTPRLALPTQLIEIKFIAKV